MKNLVNSAIDLLVPRETRDLVVEFASNPKQTIAEAVATVTNAASNPKVLIAGITELASDPVKTDKALNAALTVCVVLKVVPPARAATTTAIKGIGVLKALNGVRTKHN